MSIDQSRTVLTCGFCWNIGLHECCLTSGCWNRTTPKPTSKEEQEKEALEAAKAMYAQGTVAELQKAKEEGGHQAMVSVLHERYPHVFKKEREEEERRKKRNAAKRRRRARRGK